MASKAKITCATCGLKSNSIGGWHGVFNEKKKKAEDFCPDCWNGNFTVDRRTPLTEWQKKKLRWYRNEREWHDDIRGRVINKDGSVSVYDHKGNLKEVRQRDGN